MKKYKLKSGVMAILFFALGNIHAQEAIPTTGGEASGKGGTASYTVGQMVYTTYAGTGGNTIAQGVQQPFEISVVTGIENAENIDLIISAYPNPTTDHLTLSIDDLDLSKLSYQLYDMQGKLLKNAKITGKQTSIVMSNLVPATYFVKVIRGNTEIKTFKIIKTK